MLRTKGGANLGDLTGTTDLADIAVRNMLERHQLGTEPGYIDTIEKLASFSGSELNPGFLDLDQWIATGDSWQHIQDGDVLDDAIAFLEGIGFTALGTASGAIRLGTGLINVSVNVVQGAIEAVRTVSEGVTQTFDSVKTTISGSLQNLQTEIEGVGKQAEIFFQNLTDVRGEFRFREGSAIIDIDVDGDGEFESSTRLLGDFDLNRFFVFEEATGTRVVYAAEALLDVSEEADRVIGLDISESIDALGGDDSLLGNGGDDSLLGGTGADLVDGGSGNDLLDGGADSDTLIGGAGLNIIDGGGGIDIAVFEAALADFDVSETADGLRFVRNGEDTTVTEVETFVFDGESLSFAEAQEAVPNTPPVITSDAAFSAAENQTIAGSIMASDDKAGATFSITGGADAALLTINAGTGALRFRAAPDFEAPGDANGDNVHDLVVTVTDSGGQTASQSVTVTVTDVDEAVDPVDPADPVDPVDPIDPVDPVDPIDPVDPVDPVDPFDPPNSTDPTDPTDPVGPSNGDDTLIGTAQNDTINALAGDDNVRSLAGDDVLIGAGGSDSLVGGGGNDNIRGSGGNDTVKGGGGADNLFGNGGADLVLGNGGADTIRAGGGADEARGGGGADDILGGGGADTIRGNGGGDTLRGNGGADEINGGGGADLILGGGGADRLVGGGGNDTLRGDGGNDVFIGGNGRDVFQFRANDRIETVQDFRQGQDQIEILSGANAFAALDIEQDGADVLISFGQTEISVVTDSVEAFDEDDFIF